LLAKSKAVVLGSRTAQVGAAVLEMPIAAVTRKAVEVAAVLEEPGAVHLISPTYFLVTTVVNAVSVPEARMAAPLTTSQDQRLALDCRF